VVNAHQRPKVEEYGDHYFAVARMAAGQGAFETEQVGLFFGRDFVVTFRERAADSFEPVRERIRKGKGKVRSAGPAYLAYALLDSIVDHYFPALEAIGDRLEALEEEILGSPTTATLARVNRTKRDLIAFRRAVWPLREALGTLLRDPSDLIGEEVAVYLRDCHDHTVQIMDLVETYRELAGGLVDSYLSIVSNRMNEVMKVLTIIATVFIPLTFVAGIYGMNLDMPETEWPWAYPATLGLMALIAGAMFLYFRRKGWLGRG
jgi:magnesium transporter